MEEFNPKLLNNLYTPPSDSHKGMNGKLMIIGGSHLFHSASLWSLQVASRIVDMVFYSSVPENNRIVEKLKKEFRNGIIVPRDQVEDYINEADCILIGPGMLRASHELKSQSSNLKNLKEINLLEDEGEQAYFLTKYLLEKYPKKKWVIDAGALQMMEPEWLVPLKGNVILTPHAREFERVFSSVIPSEVKRSRGISYHKGGLGSEIPPRAALGRDDNNISEMAKKYNCVILVKGEKDIVCSPEKCVEIGGGNAGMTKGGTGDVLAGLVAALACKNDLFLAAVAGSYINKKAGDSLFEKVGYHFNASDLAYEIPVVMNKLINK